MVVVCGCSRSGGVQCSCSGSSFLSFESTGSIQQATENKSRLVPGIPQDAQLISCLTPHTETTIVTVPEDLSMTMRK